MTERSQRGGNVAREVESPLVRLARELRQAALGRHHVIPREAALAHPAPRDEAALALGDGFPHVGQGAAGEENRALVALLCCIELNYLTI